ncbi:MAG TPA: rhodanese-like domain-containing protein [Verrucomicrobiales bacterium]|nr:rhodanese-like domain-containing protein [Verrucomicrobiales bacterium]
MTRNTKQGRPGRLRWLRWLLIAGAAAPLLWFAGEAVWDDILFRERGGMVYQNLSADEVAVLLAEREEVMPLDLRTDQEFARGHLPQARRLGAAAGAGSGEPLTELDREQPCLIYCAGGFRSRLTLGKMRALGFREVYHLNRGVLGWRLSGRELERDEAVE